jgi:transcriptional regulatory protein RtcR
LVHCFELLYGPKEEKLAKMVADDIVSVSPETEVRLHAIAFADPWDFEEVYGGGHDIAERI